MFAEIIAVLIVAVSIVFAIRHVYRLVTGKDSGCHSSGCSDCSLCDVNFTDEKAEKKADNDEAQADNKNTGPE